jgi:hypothetical protein
VSAPFLSFYTPTFRRPAGLAACLASVGGQTYADHVEQIVIPDHVGIGIGGMFQQIPQYAAAIHGEYVHVLADDDVLANPTVVELLYRRLNPSGGARVRPAMVVVSAEKGGAVWPAGGPCAPQEGAIDLGCLITRADIWREHVYAYGARGRYEGDFDFVKSVYDSGHAFLWMTEILFSRGGVSRGAPEPV